MEYSETVPIQYQNGYENFMEMDIKVDPRVLIPRPETELLVSISADFLLEKADKKPVVLDLGTGSGVIALVLARLIEDCSIIATDISSDALDVARDNIDRFGCNDNVRFVSSDMFDVFDETYEGKFNAIISNPPYVSKMDYNELDAWVREEPRTALYSGVEGMDHLSVIAEQSGKFLAKGGFVAVECGYDQASKVKGLFSEHGFSRVTSFKDFNGYERVIIGWKRG